MGSKNWTYKEIQKFIKDNDGFVPKTCWIADVKSRCGIEVRIAPNRIDIKHRKYPCLPDKIEKIKNALKRLGIIKIILLISACYHFS